MVTMIVAGLVLLLVVAIVVGITDAARAPQWRRLAAQRRETWEARRAEYHGIDASDSWDDD